MDGCECGVKLKLLYFTVPSGKDKGEQATFVYECPVCKAIQRKQAALGDKGGMNSDL